MSDQGRLVAGRYRLLSRIGRGGMGTVWRAEDELLGRQVAVKKLHVPPQLHDDERATLYERTRREARSAARITHPNVVVVHDVVEDEGLPCIVMEYVRSRTLGEVIKKDGPLEPGEAARIGRGMVAALRAAHRAGVLHRDVKPANVLLGEAEDASGGAGRGADQPEGGWPGSRIVLTDFGIAAASGTSTLTRTGELVGSFDYLSPERIRGRGAGPASDLWALGATLYQALEGEAPFHRDTPIETAYAICADPLKSPDRAGPLAPVIEGLLRKEPEERLTAEQVERLLVGSADTVHASGGPVAPPPVHGTGGDDRSHGAGDGDRQLPTGGRGFGPAPDDTPVTSVQGPATGPERNRRRGGRRSTVWAAVSVVAVSALAAGVLWSWPLGSRDGEGGGEAGGARPSTTPGTASASPSGSASPSALPPPPPAPEGYRSVHDPLGFSVTVPETWTRTEKAHGQEVNYIAPGGLVGLKFSVLDFAGASPLQHWKDIEPDVRSKLSGYERLRMNRTTYQGRPAAYWEFAWDGRARRYRAVDLGFSAEGQREYAVYLSAPADQWREATPHFRTATDSFRLDR